MKQVPDSIKTLDVWDLLDVARLNGDTVMSTRAQASKAGRLAMMGRGTPTISLSVCFQSLDGANGAVEKNLIVIVIVAVTVAVVTFIAAVVFRGGWAPDPERDPVKLGKVD